MPLSPLREPFLSIEESNSQVSQLFLFISVNMPSVQRIFFRFDASTRHMISPETFKMGGREASDKTKVTATCEQSCSSVAAGRLDEQLQTDLGPSCTAHVAAALIHLSHRIS